MGSLKIAFTVRSSRYLCSSNRSERCTEYVAKTTTVLETGVAGEPHKHGLGPASGGATVLLAKTWVRCEDAQVPRAFWPCDKPSVEHISTRLEANIEVAS